MNEPIPRIFYADSNGINKVGAVLRNGRRVLIDEDKFFKWLRGMQS